MTRPTSTPTLAELLVEGARVERRRLRGIVRKERAKWKDDTPPASILDDLLALMVPPRKP